MLVAGHDDDDDDDDDIQFLKKALKRQKLI